MRSARLIMGLLLVAADATAAELADGWRALAGYKAGRALAIFDRQLAAADAGQARAARFGRAVALLDRQPVTAAQLDEARGIFTALAESGADDTAQGARFFLGRIAQHHQSSPDPAEAARQFRRLIAEHEGSVWAQSALSRLALLELYALNPAAPPAARVAAAEKLLGHVRTPAAESEVRYAVANAVLFYRLPAATALPHLLTTERLGRLGWAERIEVLVQIAELSRLGGDAPQAARFYRIFLKENPRDQRQFIVRQKLAALESN